LQAATVAEKCEDSRFTLLGWLTNGPAVYSRNSLVLTKEEEAKVNPLLLPLRTNLFVGFQESSMNHAVWTNFLCTTNGKTTPIWEERQHPAKWPAEPPKVRWNQQSLVWGLKGMTAMSPCWENDVPLTALTRRHVYGRGHGMGPQGSRTQYAGKKVWFLSAGNSLIEVRMKREVIRTYAGGGNGDYGIILLDRDLPACIEPMSVASQEVLAKKYSQRPDAPWIVFQSEQLGHINTGHPGLTVNAWKGGDSGSPDMVPLPGELVLFGGRGTSGPSSQMQADMDALSKLEGLDPKQYQLRWKDLSAYPDY